MSAAEQADESGFKSLGQDATDAEVRERVEAAESGRSWPTSVAHALHHVGNYGVDVAAIAGLTALGLSPQVDAALAQVLGGMVVSVALGKRYLTKAAAGGGQ